MTKGDPRRTFMLVICMCFSLNFGRVDGQDKSAVETFDAVETSEKILWQRGAKFSKEISHSRRGRVILIETKIVEHELVTLVSYRFFNENENPVFVWTWNSINSVGSQSFVSRKSSDEELSLFDFQTDGLVDLIAFGGGNDREYFRVVRPFEIVPIDNKLLEGAHKNGQPWLVNKLSSNINYQSRTFGDANDRSVYQSPSGVSKSEQDSLQVLKTKEPVPNSNVEKTSIEYLREGRLIQRTLTFVDGKSVRQVMDFFDEAENGVLAWSIDDNGISTIEYFGSKTSVEFCDCQNDGYMDVLVISVSNRRSDDEYFLIPSPRGVSPISSDLLRAARENNSYWLLDKLAEEEKEEEKQTP